MVNVTLPVINVACAVSVQCMEMRKSDKKSEEENNQYQYLLHLYDNHEQVQIQDEVELVLTLNHNQAHNQRVQVQRLNPMWHNLIMVDYKQGTGWSHIVISHRV